MFSPGYAPAAYLRQYDYTRVYAATKLAFALMDSTDNATVDLNATGDSRIAVPVVSKLTPEVCFVRGCLEHNTCPMAFGTAGHCLTAAACSAAAVAAVPSTTKPPMDSHVAHRASLLQIKVDSCGGSTAAGYTMHASAMAPESRGSQWGIQLHIACFCAQGRDKVRDKGGVRVGSVAGAGAGAEHRGWCGVRRRFDRLTGDPHPREPRGCSGDGRGPTGAAQYGPPVVSE